MLFLAGCAEVHDAAPIGGALTVLGPDQQLIEAVSHGALPDGWEVSGDMPADALSIHQIEAFRALKVKAGDTPFVLIRHTQASLLATPFLSWAWHTQPPRTGGHPVRIIVGLADRSGKSAPSPWWQLGGNGDGDKVTRVIQIVWNATALGRGSVIGPLISEDHPESARYVARGGPEQADHWWVDAVDLSLIHRQIWPDDDAGDMDIRFIGIAVRTTKHPATMNIAAIRLLR